MVEVVEAVVDRRRRVVLDGPEIDGVGGQGPVAERGVLQELPRRDIDDGRAGELFSDDPVRGGLEGHDAGRHGQKKDDEKDGRRALPDRRALGLSEG
jgi:hypothetical protein